MVLAFFISLFFFIQEVILSVYYNSRSKHVENQAKFDATLISQK